MSNVRVAVLTWTLIFGGSLSFALFWTIRRAEPALAWTGVTLSLAAVAVGIVLIWVRSRSAPDDRSEQRKPP